MNGIENNFIKQINKVKDECAGSEDFGDVTEFYDEDGCVLMTCTRKAPNTLEFKFADGEEFEYNEFC